MKIFVISVVVENTDIANAASFFPILIIEGNDKFQLEISEIKAIYFSHQSSQTFWGSERGFMDPHPRTPMLNPGATYRILK